MAVYNVDKIDNWYNDFVSLKNKFNNTYYSDYKSSYIRSCSDSAVKKMQSSLDEYYSKIQKMYNSINTAWNSYLKDLKNTDRRLAGGKGGINASSVSSKLAKLPVLQEYKRSLEVRIKSISGVVGTAKGIGWSENRTIDQNLEYLKNRVGATITTAGVSLVEGLGIFAEGLVDVAAITTTGIATVIAYATSDADEAREISDQIWEDCRAFTSKQYVKSAFNSFYENTDVGKSLKKDSYAFDVVRSVGNEVGEVLGAVGISVATGGVINPAILYGTSKAGTHVEENWQDENTSTAAGLVKGTLQGIGDGIFFALGMKGDAVMKSAAINAVKKGGQQALKKTAILTGKTLFECGCSVAQDGSNILINAIFSDDIVKSQDGKDVKLNSFGDKLNYYYNQAGGMEGLMTSMATASVLSFASDFVDVSKVGKNIYTNAAIKNTDINANNMKNTIEGINPKNIEVSSNVKKANVNDNLDALKKEYDELLNKSKESWFVKAKEASDNGWAWDLNKVSEADNIVKRMQELESTLGVKNTGVPESKIYDYSQAKKEADAMVQKMRNEPIPALEKYKVDTNSEKYQKALKEYYSKPSPSGKQDLSHIENPINLKNTDLNKNIASRTINSNLSKMQSLPKTLAGIFASVPAAITKMKNVDITPGSKIFKKIQSEGLYHFTDEVSAKKILDSGYIKESSNFTSYGKKRTFLFAGVPTVEDTCLNSVFDYKKTAVKLHPSDAEISGLQYRKYSDSAVSSIGNYDITNSSPEIAYLVLKEQDGVLKYVEVPKAEYDNYNPHFNDNVINKTVENAKKKIYQTTVGISAEYDNVVKGVKQYAGDLKDKLYKVTKRSSNSKIPVKNSKGILNIKNSIEGVNPKNIEVSSNLNKISSELYRFIEKNTNKPINIEKWFKDNNVEISIDDLSTDFDVAIEVGDPNLYYLSVLERNGINTDSLNIGEGLQFDSVRLEQLATPYLSKNDLLNIQTIKKKANKISVSNNQKATFFQFQEVGGYEISAYKRGKKGGDIYRYENGKPVYFSKKWEDISNLEDAINRHPKNAGSPRTKVQGESFIDTMNITLESVSNDKVMKGVSYYNSMNTVYGTDKIIDAINKYGPNSKEVMDLLNASKGIEISDSCFSSRTIPPSKETSYSKDSANKIEVRTYILPGCGTYADSISSRYGLGEMILKPDCKQVTTDAFIDPKTGRIVFETVCFPPNEVGLSYGNLFDANKNGISIETINAEIKSTGLDKKIESAINEMHAKKLYDGKQSLAYHGYEHVENVTKYAMYIGDKMGLSKTQQNLLRDCAIYHDVGVVDNLKYKDLGNAHTGHATKSALWAGDDLTSKYSVENIKKVQAIIELHENHLDEKNIINACKKYGIVNQQDINEVGQLASILKDADALDRTRFPGGSSGLDPNRLRTNVAKRMVKGAYQNTEQQASKRISNLLNNSNLPSNQHDDILELINSGKYPDQVILFATENFKRNNIQRSIYNKSGQVINSIKQYADYIINNKEWI